MAFVNPQIISLIEKIIRGLTFADLQIDLYGNRI